VKGDRVEIVIDAGGSTRSYEIEAPCSAEDDDPPVTRLRATA